MYVAVLFVLLLHLAMVHQGVGWLLQTGGGLSSARSRLHLRVSSSPLSPLSPLAHTRTLAVRRALSAPSSAEEGLAYVPRRGMLETAEPLSAAYISSHSHTEPQTHTHSHNETSLSLTDHTTHTMDTHNSTHAENLDLLNTLAQPSALSVYERLQRYAADPRLLSLRMRAPSLRDALSTRYQLWRERLWSSPLTLCEGPFVIKTKLSGALPLESPPERPSLFSSFSPAVDSLPDATSLLYCAACDPRVSAVVVEVDGLHCGHGKLTELLRAVQFFRETASLSCTNKNGKENRNSTNNTDNSVSNNNKNNNQCGTIKKKKVIAYMKGGSLKEYLFAAHCDEVYLCPEASLDLRGFSASCAFYRDFYEKIGVEPQHQRIGKYKSFGDVFLRTNMSDAQREVSSSILTQSAQAWVESVARARSLSPSTLWELFSEEHADKAFQLNYLQEKGLFDGLLYPDQFAKKIEREFAHSTLTQRVSHRCAQLWRTLTLRSETTSQQKENELEEDFDLERDFAKHPRRSLLPSREHREKEREKEKEPTAPVVVNETLSEILTQAHNPAKQRSPWLSRIPVVPRFLHSVFSIFVPPQSKDKPSLAVRSAGWYLHRMEREAHCLSTLPFVEAENGPRIGVINAAGAITEGASGKSLLTGETVGADTLIALIRKAKDDPDIKAVVLRIDSPGGSALASDLVWRELRLLSREKPLVASMADVAASGGYYFAMGCDQIVAEPLTLTGSIGVVLGKMNWQELQKKIGVNEETLSIGKYAELLSMSKGFSPEEQAAFASLAQQSYRSFVAKAAASRGMNVSAMDAIAQGRVWTGQQAHARGLVDFLGGFWKAVEVAGLLAMFDWFGAHKNQTGWRVERELQQHLFSLVYKPHIDTVSLYSPLWEQMLSSFLEENEEDLSLPSPRNTQQQGARTTEVLALGSSEVFSAGLGAPLTHGHTSGVLTQLGVGAEAVAALAMTQPLQRAQDALQGMMRRANAPLRGVVERVARALTSMR